MDNNNLKEQCAQEYIDFAIRWTEKLSPEEVLGIMECFKYVYLNRFVENQVKMKDELLKNANELLEEIEKEEKKKFMLKDRKIQKVEK